MAELIKQTDEYAVYKYRQAYRVHFYSDEGYIEESKIKSFITKDYEKVKKFL